MTSKDKKKVNAIVVTYNRKNMLLECIDALLNQTYPVAQITLVDNASSDGTKKLLDEKEYLKNKRINYIRLAKNTGGAGGFYEGLKETENSSYDYAWVMDDDVIVKADSLEKLIDGAVKLDKLNRKVSFLASSVYGEKNEPMNVPQINMKPTKNGYPNWYIYLKEGLIPVQTATFVSLLIDYKAIKKVGLPCKEYFIWGDDIEYTSRLTKYFGEAFLVGNSEVIHKRKNAKSLSIENIEEPERIKMMWRLYRNNKINIRYYEGTKSYLKAMIRDGISIFRLFGKKYVYQKSKQIIKGNLLSVRDYSKIKRFIDTQLGDKDA